MDDFIAIVAILKNEDRFVDEWIAYHRLLGADHFVLYDDDPRQHLRNLLRKHERYVTVFDRSEPYDLGTARNRQLRAYEHAIRHTKCQWVAFIDGDEFIVLRKHETLRQFLANFGNAEAVILTWHMFGHSGYYDDPTDLITSVLTKRQARPGKMMKSIVRREAVTAIWSVHWCKTLNDQAVFDANHRCFTRDNYDGKTAVANINHYLCRSFSNWMARVRRGELAYLPSSYPVEENWRYEEEECLKKFVQISAEHNEVVDTLMCRFHDPIVMYLARL